MRVLVSVLPGTGHLLPLLPVLHALRDAGDTVVVASAEPLRAEVEAAGLDFAAVGPPRPARPRRRPAAAAAGARALGVRRLAGEPLAAARTAAGLPAEPALSSLYGRG